MEKKNVVFISYNSHQKKFFSKIKRYLDKNKNKCYLIDSKYIFLNKIFIKNEIKRNIDNYDLDEIIKYTYKKFILKNNKKKSSLTKKVYKKYLFVKAKLFIKYFIDYFIKQNIDLVIVWNGANIVAASASEVAKSLGIKTLYLEGGFFPGTIVMDTEGVNAKSSLMNNDKEFYEDLEIDGNECNLINNISLEQRQLRTNKKVITEEKIELPSKFVFLPLQVHSDSQIILNSPLIDDMYQLVNKVYDSLQIFNEKYDKNYWLVVKEHPSDYGRVNYSGFKKKYKNKKIIFLTKTPAEKLIEKSELVITINSTVGLESLSRSKNVITLGKAFYNINDLVYNCQSLAKIPDKIAEAAKNDFNYDLANKFLYYLKEEYLVAIDKDDLTYEDKERFKIEINNLFS